MFHRILLTGFIAIVAALGCGSDPDVSEVRMHLVGTDQNGVTYRLRDGTLVVSTRPATRLSTNLDTIDLDLAPGDYTVRLLDGWRLERERTGVTEEVEATLLSPNPQSFTILSGESTPVSFRFQVDGTTVVTGPGSLDVTIDIEDVSDAGTGDPDGGSVDGTCGNGLVDPGEECDPAVLGSEACCSADCVAAAPGTFCGGNCNPSLSESFVCNDRGLCVLATDTGGCRAVDCIDPTSNGFTPVLDHGACGAVAPCQTARCVDTSTGACDTTTFDRCDGTCVPTIEIAVAVDHLYAARYASAAAIRSRVEALVDAANLTLRSQLGVELELVVYELFDVPSGDGFNAATPAADSATLLDQWQTFIRSTPPFDSHQGPRLLLSDRSARGLSEIGLTTVGSFCSTFGGGWVSDLGSFEQSLTAFLHHVGHALGGGHASTAGFALSPMLDPASPVLYSAEVIAQMQSEIADASCVRSCP